MHFPVFIWCSCYYFFHQLLFGVFFLQPALYGKLEGLHKKQAIKGARMDLAKESSVV